jgi:amino acid adenylation domain-containing protein
VSEEHVGILLRQFDSTINSALEHPDEAALSFDSLDSDLLAQENEIPAVIYYSRNELLHSQFEQRAIELPDHVALEYLDDDGSTTTWTFKELNENSNKLAHHLLSLGVARDEAIPICLEKSFLFYICVLGVLKAGCAFTPVDQKLPTNRKEFMIRELQARIVIVDSVDSLGPIVDSLVVLLANELLVLDKPVANPSVPDLSERSLAYRLYTSGSTGLPKAVSVEHKSAVQTIHASKPIIRWDSKSRLLQFAATTFDMCYYDIFMAWSYGFTLCSAAKIRIFGELEETIRLMHISILDLTPSVASTLRADRLPNVKMLYCIGEAMPQKMAAEWEGRCVSSYGPTEAAMCCTITEVSRDINTTNIGKPFETTRFMVLANGTANMLPIFGAGELCIGGPQIAREYHNNPELTKSKFIPFRGDTIYRTGDIVRQIGDRSFEFLGRADDQIKIRGLRVELNEINSVLTDASGGIFKASFTIVSKHRASGSKPQLVSFLAKEGQKPIESTSLEIYLNLYDTVDSIRETALKALPSYMVPGIILVVSHIPLSTAGKIDKMELEKLFQAQDIESFGCFPKKTELTGASPWTGMEQKIREVLAEIAQVEKEKIHKSSTIYEIGLDSISATQVASKLKRLGLELTVLDILEVRIT